MNERNDGGPAFPQFASDGMFDYKQSGGLTLRDYFAAKAMEAMLIVELRRDYVAAPSLAVGAYRMADAMLAARSEA